MKSVKNELHDMHSTWGKKQWDYFFIHAIA